MASYELSIQAAGHRICLGDAGWLRDDNLIPTLCSLADRAVGAKQLVPAVELTKTNNLGSLASKLEIVF